MITVVLDWVATMCNFSNNLIGRAFVNQINPNDVLITRQGNFGPKNEHKKYLDYL